jgi:hypothetical protein
MENAKTVKAANLNNDLIDQVLASTEQKTAPKIDVETPSDTLVNLPAGYINSSGEVIKTAEVRELNGLDEEAIARAGSAAKAFNTILSRATVKVGDEQVDDTLLDSLLAGDRDALMLGIYKVTFGKTAQLPGYCAGCNDFKIAEVDVDRDVPVKVLADSISDRTFIVNGNSNEFRVTLPNGRVQREITQAEDKNSAELTTLLLNNTVLEINEQPVLGKAQLQALSVSDRRAISDAISKRLPGPQFEDLNIPCPDCNGEVVVPFNLGALFRF